MKAGDVGRYTPEAGVQPLVTVEPYLRPRPPPPRWQPRQQMKVRRV